MSSVFHYRPRPSGHRAGGAPRDMPYVSNAKTASLAQHECVTSATTLHNFVVTQQHVASRFTSYPVLPAASPAAYIASSDVESLTSSDDYLPSIGTGELRRQRTDALAQLTAFGRAVTKGDFTWMVRTHPHWATAPALQFASTCPRTISAQPWAHPRRVAVG